MNAAILPPIRYRPLKHAVKIPGKAKRADLKRPALCHSIQGTRYCGRALAGSVALSPLNTNFCAREPGATSLV